MPWCALPTYPCRSHARRGRVVPGVLGDWRSPQRILSPAASHSNKWRRIERWIIFPPLDAIVPSPAETKACPFDQEVFRLLLLPLHRVESDIGAVVLGCSFHS